MSDAAIRVISAIVDGATLHLVVAVDDGQAALDTSLAELTDYAGRQYAVKPVAPANELTSSATPQHRYRAAIDPVRPEADPPALLLTIDGQSVWFAPTSPSDSATPPAPSGPNRAGTTNNDYRGRDYDFFAALMRGRIATRVGANSNWAMSQPADPLTTIVEALAYAGDHLSFRQDAAGTESYLPTARYRLSLRRHARLRDYAINDGCAARTALAFTVNADAILPAGTCAVSLQPGVTATMLPASTTLAPATTVYETMEPIFVAEAHNDLAAALPVSDTAIAAGTISVTLNAKLPLLRPGQLMIFSQTEAPTGAAAFGVHVIRLLALAVTETTTAISWHPEDALPAPLLVPATGKSGAVSLFANVVLADHGRTLTIDPPSPDTVGDAAYAPIVTVADPVVAAPAPPIAAGFDGGQPIAVASLMVPSGRASLVPDPTRAVPAISLTATLPGPAQATQDWQPVADLLDMPGSAPRFATALEEGVGGEPRRLKLRFGSGGLGGTPPAGTRFAAKARTGDGLTGRIRAGTLVQLWGAPDFVTGVTNPLAAEPVLPETAAAIRLFAATGFATNLRGVTPDDWNRIASTDPLITAHHVTAGRDGGGPCTIGLATAEPGDLCFAVAKARLLEQSIIGAPPTIEPASDVPLVISLTVHCHAKANIGTMRQRLRAALGSGLADDGTPAYFNPARWPLGRPVELAPIIAAIRRDSDVAAVLTDPAIDPRLRFARIDAPADSDANFQAGVIAIAPHERARIANQPGQPGAGTVQLYLVAAI